ncbi:uncharacterized protein [Miscanthus floridulus]|uniref:uncharacterized protein n=1 Tax=Miscanthus floridulus TaxID=154761 RepID=UPI003457DD81
MGRGPLDHLPDIGEMVPGASASSPVLLGGAILGSAIARPGAEADMPEARALGKRAVSSVGSTAAAEQVVAGATQPPPQRTEGVPGFVEDRPALVDTEVMLLPPRPPLQMRVAVPKWLQPRSGRKRPAEVLALAPLKALKVNPGSTAHWVAEAQTAIQCGAVSGRANPKEPANQAGAAEATPTQTGAGVPPPLEGKARESDGAEVPSVAEASEVEAPGVTEAEAMEAGAPETAEAAAVGVVVSMTTEATMAEAEAPETTKADVTASRDDPEGEPLFALEDAAEGGRWDTFEQYRELAERSLRMALSVVANDLPGVAQVAPLAARVKELEEELTRVADDRDAFRSRAEEATASGKVLVGQLGAEQSAHQLTKGALDEALMVVEASWTEAVVWRGKAEELEAEVTWAAEASVAVQAVLETKIREHEALKGAACTTYEALEVKGV